MIRVKFTLKYSEDYRSGTKIWVDKQELLVGEDVSDVDSDDDISDSSEELEENEFVPMYLDVPNKHKYVVYILSGEYCMEGISFKILETDDEKEAKETLKYLYSEINGHQQFVTTGYTSSYKEEGHYPDALPSKNLVTEKMRKYIDRQDYTMGMVVDKDRIVSYVQILPEF